MFNEAVAKELLFCYLIMYFGVYLHWHHTLFEVHVSTNYLAASTLHKVTHNLQARPTSSLTRNKWGSCDESQLN